MKQNKGNCKASDKSLKPMGANNDSKSMGAGKGKCKRKGRK